MVIGILFKEIFHILNQILLKFAPKGQFDKSWIW